jgi:hypothetical protein
MLSMDDELAMVETRGRSVITQLIVEHVDLETAGA